MNIVIGILFLLFGGWLVVVPVKNILNDSLETEGAAFIITFGLVSVFIGVLCLMFGFK